MTGETRLVCQRPFMPWKAARVVGGAAASFHRATVARKAGLSQLSAIEALAGFGVVHGSTFVSLPLLRLPRQSWVLEARVAFNVKCLLEWTVCSVRLRRVQPAAWRRGGLIHTASLPAAGRATQMDPKRRFSRHRKTTTSARSGSATFTGRIKLSPFLRRYANITLNRT